MNKLIRADYRLQQDQKYLTLADQQLTGDEYVLRMLERNDLNGYLKPSLKAFNGEPCLWYNISGLQTLEKIYDHRSMDSETLEALFQAMESAIDLADEYLLRAGDLVMEPGYIYCQTQRNQFSFVYYPGSGAAAQKPYEPLAEFILRRLSHSDRRALELGYQFYEGASNDNFSFTDMMEDIRDGKTQLLQIPPAPEQPGRFSGFPEPAPVAAPAGRSGEYRKQAGKKETQVPGYQKGSPAGSASAEKHFAAGAGKPAGKTSPGQSAGVGRKVLLYAAAGLILAGLYIVLTALLRPGLQAAGGLACVMIAAAVLGIRLFSRKKVPHNEWEEEKTPEEEDDLAFMEELMQENYARPDERPGRSA